MLILQINLMSSCCVWKSVVGRFFFVISVVFVYSYLNTGVKKHPAAREETQVGSYFVTWTACL